MDPMGYVDGQNLYNYYPGVNGVDPLGLFEGDQQGALGGLLPFKNNKGEWTFAGPIWDWVEEKVVFQQPPANAPPPLEMSFGKEVTPVYGSLKHLGNSLDRGNYYGAAWYSLMAVTDVSLVKSATIGGFKGAAKLADVMAAAGRTGEIAVEKGLPTAIESADDIVKVMQGSGKGNVFDIESRVTQLHGALIDDAVDPTRRAFNSKTTAVLEVQNPDGSINYIISSSDTAVPVVQRKLLGVNEFAALGEGHAEMTAINLAFSNGQTPLRIAISRGACLDCEVLVKGLNMSPSAGFTGKYSRIRKYPLHLE